VDAHHAPAQRSRGGWSPAAGLGYKNPKHIKAIFVTNTYPGVYWEDQGCNWFGGNRVGFDSALLKAGGRVLSNRAH